MSALDSAAISAARAKYGFAHAAFDDRTEFIEKVLDWLLDRLAEGQLANGQSVTLVSIDYLRQSAAAKGVPVKLNHGKFVQGSIHLCNRTLSRANLLPGASDLGNVQGHEDALKDKQYADDVSVTYHPTTGVAHVRIPCAGSVHVVPIKLCRQPSANWSASGMTELENALSNFHAGLNRASGLGALMFDAGSLRPNASIIYRNAVYMYLRFEMGLNQTGFSVSADKREVQVKVTANGFTARLKAIGTRVGSPTAAGRRIQRELAIAVAETGQGEPPALMSCISCPTSVPSSQECAVAPNSLRHRHVA
ncbi:hypothetical protein [uncultured Sphingomonas sp.]|uniref:hypothetical protein n=1 Tax=uncultured Sphingomonas sp. TaxID=158754 RepID=UPI00260CADDC|nr:hypothetical protein [uncultured Sphingomonas sp.]